MFCFCQSNVLWVERLKNMHGVCAVAKNALSAAGLFPAVVASGEFVDLTFEHSKWNFKHTDPFNPDRQITVYHVRYI